MMKKTLSILGFVFLMLALSSPALANKPTIAIQGPNAVPAGTEVTLTIMVFHHGNSIFHHTNWVVAKADGVEIARWEFRGRNLPESENFTREIKYKVTKPVEISGQGHCNIHGSKDPVVFKIGVR
jgi:desulfoferrodoxin (superoxide reductase-like protein)